MNRLRSILVRLPEGMLSMLDAEAVRNGTSRTGMIRLILLDYLLHGSKVVGKRARRLDEEVRAEAVSDETV